MGNREIKRENYPDGDGVKHASQSSDSLNKGGMSIYQQGILASLERLVSEHREIKRSKAWRVSKWLWGLPLYLRLRALVKDRLGGQPAIDSTEASQITIRATGDKNRRSKGSEAWLLHVVTPEGSLGFDRIKVEEGFRRRIDPNSPVGEVFYSDSTGMLRIPSGKKVDSLILLAHPWSGMVRVECETEDLMIDLYSRRAGDVTIDLGSGTVLGPRGLNHIVSRTSKQPVERSGHGGSRRAEDDQKWLESLKERPPTAIAVLHPEWLGIRSASTQLFTAFLWVGDDVDPNKAMRYASLLKDSGCERVVFSGFSLSHRHIAIALREIAPKVRIFILWHGNLMQSREEYNWAAYHEAINLARKGDVYKIGFVKKGMAAAHEHLLGIRSAFVKNYFQTIPEAPSKTLGGGPHLGLWSIWADNWRKPPFAMLAAAAMIPSATIHGSHLSTRMESFMRLLGIQGDFIGEPIPQNEMPTALAGMHVNLYVTLSECAPMLPLESLSVGVPCLLGPNSHLFQDHEYLHSRLVVPYPDCSQTIREYIERAIEEREHIVEAYREYAPDYNARARQSVAEFLEVDRE